MGTQTTHRHSARIETPHHTMRTFFLIFCIAISTAAFMSADENIPEDDFAVFEEEDGTQDELTQLEADVCSKARNAHTKQLKQVKGTISTVANALKRQKKLCDAQEKEAKKRKQAEDLAKKAVTGETFKFKASPCKGGSGKFKKMMQQDARATVGLIPAGQNNVKVQLSSTHDLDVELWGEFGKIALVAWRCKYMNRKVHKTPTNCLDSATKASLQYAGGKITYSGWVGTDGKMGNEYIHITGKLKVPVMVRAYGYVKGNAAVTYSWGADKALCQKKQKEAKAEKKAKHDAKVAAKKAMNEKDLKKVEKLLAAVTKTCSGAHTQTKKAKARLKYARKLVFDFKAHLDKCIDMDRKEKKHKKEHKHKLAAKTKKELQSKAKEKAKKKAEAKKKEVAEKKELKEKAAKADAREKAGKKKEKAAKKAEKAKKAEQAKKEKAKKETATKKEKADKKAEKASKAKEKAGKRKERKHKAELRAKAEKRAKAIEKAQKKKKEKSAKRQEKRVKETVQKETS